jgi:hypothetical protein
MQRRHPILRILLLPIDLLFFAVMAVRIALWHSKVAILMKIIRSPGGTSFCHPDRVDFKGERLLLCPFARRFGNPELFALLCGHCTRGSRAPYRSSFFCFRTGSGPDSQLALVFFGILPVAAAVAVVLWIALPGVHALSRLSSTQPPATPGTEAAAVVETPEREEAQGTTAETGTAAPSALTPDRSRRRQTPVPPPPLGLTPQERRRKAIDSETRQPAAASEAQTPIPPAQQALKTRHYETVLALTRAILDTMPGDEEALLLQAKAQLALRQYSAARVSLNQLLTAGQHLAEVHALLGDAFLAEGDGKQAKANYMTALRHDPDCLPAKQGLARIAVQGATGN